MVVIRLVRAGSKKRPFYQIVAADKRSPLTGRYIQSLGFYNPIARGQDEKIQIDVDAVEKFIKDGAQPSDRFISVVKAHNRALKASGQAEIADRLSMLSTTASEKRKSAPKAEKKATKAKAAPAKKAAAPKKEAAAKKPAAKKTTASAAKKPAASKKTAAAKKTTKE